MYDLTAVYLIYIFIVICCCMRLFLLWFLLPCLLLLFSIVCRFLSLFFGVSVLFLDIFDTDFGSISQPVSREVALLMEKLKFTALASRTSRISIRYTRAFNRWRSFAADV